MTNFSLFTMNVMPVLRIDCPMILMASLASHAVLCHSQKVLAGQYGWTNENSQGPTLLKWFENVSPKLSALTWHQYNLKFLPQRYTCWSTVFPAVYYSFREFREVPIHRHDQVFGQCLLSQTTASLLCCGLHEG